MGCSSCLILWRLRPRVLRAVLSSQFSVSFLRITLLDKVNGIICFA